MFLEYKEISWWYWLLTVCLLTAGIAGIQSAFIWAIGVTVFQLVYFIIIDKSIMSFSVQVRFWYLVLLFLALPGSLQLIYWVPAAATWVQVLFGYCTMARLVSLLPWNRSEPFSLLLLQRTFLTRPVRGSILQNAPVNIVE